MFWRTIRIILSVGSLLYFIIGIPGTADDLKAWRAWFVTLFDLIAPDPNRTVFLSLGILIIVAVNTPRRAWRFLGRNCYLYLFQPIFVFVATLRNVKISSSTERVQGVLRPEVRSYIFRPRERVPNAVNDPVLELGIDLFATLPMSYGGMELKVENTILSPLEEPGIKRIPQSAGYWARFDIPPEIARGQVKAELQVIADGQVWKSELFTLDFDRVSEVNDTFFTH